MKEKRFLFILARGDAFGGSSLHVLDMASLLERDGHRAKVLVGGHPGQEVPRRLAARGIDFTCIPHLGRELSPLKDFRSLLALRREIRRFAPDLVSTHASKGGALGRLACLGLGLPVLYTPHCWSFVDGFPRAGFYRRVEKFLARFSTRIVAVSEDERQFGLSCQVGKPDQVVVVHNGIGQVPDDRPVRKSSPGSPVNVVMVGRFEDQKNQPLLLQAFAELRRLDWRLTLVGDGPRKAECMELCRSLGIEDRVDFPGYSSNVGDYLAASDIFALITHWEGFPRSILEAMRHGLPVIASDVGGCRESVIHGESGFIVPKDSLPDLVDALTRLISDRNLRTNLGRHGFDLYCEKFTLEHMYHTYLELYRPLINLPGRHLQSAEGRASSEPLSLGTSSRQPVAASRGSHD